MRTAKPANQSDHEDSGDDGDAAEPGNRTITLLTPSLKAAGHPTQVEPGKYYPQKNKRHYPTQGKAGDRILRKMDL